MSKEELLRAGIAAAKSGDRTRATALFAELVSNDPASEQGWFQLGMCLSAPDRQEYCFRRVLALNPDHYDAWLQLERLSGNSEIQAPTIDRQPPATNPPPPSQVGGPTPARSKARKPNSILLVGIGFVGILIVGGLLVAYLLLSGRMAEWMSPALPAIPTPLVMPAQTTAPEGRPTKVGAVLPPMSTPAATQPALLLPSPKPTLSYMPTFENTQCSFDVPVGAHVSCGYLIVPEDRTGDPSHTIRLAVAIYHAAGGSGLPEPVVFLQGGPGGEAVKLSAGAYTLLVKPFLVNRDFIAFDQRGTGLSEPALNCDDLTKAYSQDIQGLISGAASRKIVYSNAFLACSGLMRAQGVDPNAYTTEASAADVRDLLQVLGYQKADLYGASYGTRLAQVIMRDYPAIVDSVVLDSVVPIETNLFSNYPDAIESALKTLFDRCAADPGCNAAYPQLEKVFWDTVSQLDARPVSITTGSPSTGTIIQSVDGSTFINLVLGSIKVSSLISTAPQTIYRFKNGDYSTMIASQNSLPFAFEGISPGLYISVMCHEHVLATTPEQLQAASSAPQDIREYAWLPFYGNAQDLFNACKSWGATPPVAGENDPVSSNIPTLIITGSFDPATPPILARQVAAHLSHSYYFEFPNQGHTPTAADSSGCAMQTAQAFFDNPGVEPDRSCLDKIPAVSFILPYSGTPPIKLKNADVGGISASVPANWLTLGDGFYARSNSPFDITQIGFFRAPVSAASLMGWISMKAYGYRGLDAAPVPAGQRPDARGGLDWTLYTSTSYGRPVDIAMADTRGQSVVVISFSNHDEHDAIYRTVFLPMVDSLQP